MALTLSLTSAPASGAPATPTTASFFITLTFFQGGGTGFKPNPTGNITISVNGNVVLGPTAFVGDPDDQNGDAQTYNISLGNPAAVGNYTVQASYAGDSNYPGTVTSGTATLTVQPSSGGGTGGTTPAPATRLQAVARPVASSVAGTALTRTQIENGEYASNTFTVGSIALQSGGTSYDAYSVATLTGTVGGTATRQTLTITVDGNGTITVLTGFSSSTQWDTVPRLTITRWTSAGVFDGY